MNEQQDLESELGRLFEDSAAQPDGAVLTRMKARAADVPERASRTPRWLPRWVWAPALGGICAGIGALGATLLGETQELQPASDEPAAVIVSAAPSASLASAPASLEDESDELASDEEALSFDLSADVPDAEIDAWLAALEGP